MARRYEFNFQVVKTQENKIHIFKPPCNFLIIIKTRIFFAQTTVYSVKAGNDIINILTSEDVENT